jgi:hypothetical protein
MYNLVSFLKCKNKFSLENKKNKNMYTILLLFENGICRLLFKIDGTTPKNKLC